MGFGGDRGAEADDDQQPDAGVREGDRFHANGSFTESMGPLEKVGGEESSSDAVPAPDRLSSRTGVETMMFRPAELLFHKALGRRILKRAPP
jgi:hypothetical protein